jgi:hypothetical protein
MRLCCNGSAPIRQLGEVTPLLSLRITFLIISMPYSRAAIIQINCGQRYFRLLIRADNRLYSKCADPVQILQITEREMD